MHVAILLLICAGLSACFQTYGQGDKRVLTAPEIAEKALASTVHLFVIRGSNPYSASANFIGSGFFITPRSIVTNYHVIENFMPVLVDHMEEKQLQYRVIAIPTQVIADAKGNFDNKGVSNNVRNGNPSIIEVNHNPIFDKRFGDLAILKTITTEKQPIAIGNSDTVKIGEAVTLQAPQYTAMFPKKPKQTCSPASHLGLSPTFRFTAMDMVAKHKPLS